MTDETDRKTPDQAGISDEARLTGEVEAGHEKPEMLTLTGPEPDPATAEMGDEVTVPAADEEIGGAQDPLLDQDVTPARGGVLSRLFRLPRKGRVTEPDEGGASELVADPASEAEPVPDPDPSHENEVPSLEKTGPTGSGLARLFRRQRKEVSPAEAGDVSDPAEPFKDETPELGGGGAIDEGPVEAPVTRKKSSRKSKRGLPPIQVLIGWIEESSKRDVIEHVRGFAQDHIETLDTAWIATAEFIGGTLFEVHEGGSGQAYLPELIEEIGRDPEQVLWVPSGTKLNRVVTFSVVEGRAFSMMLNEADSARVRLSEQVSVERTGKMRRLSPRGTPVLVVGATLFAIGLSVLGASSYLASQINQQPLPALSYNPDILPHGQIVSLSTALREDRWVSRIVFEDGAWRAEFETFEELTLPADTSEAQALIEEALKRDAVLQQERDRKIEELGSE